MPLALKIQDEETRTCPLKPLCSNPGYYKELFWLYRSYQKGFLSEDGSLLSQPNVLLESFKVIDQALAQVEQEQEEREKKKEAAKKRAQQRR